jgi:hypothetical protein
MAIERIRSLHAAISEALVEADSIMESSALAIDHSLRLSTAGIGLDSARHALEAIIWPGLAEDDLEQLDALN